jgi:hypothetical protein
MSKLENHKWWHWLFSRDVGFKYRFVKKWYGTEVDYQNVYCDVCKLIVKVRFNEFDE